MAGLADSNPSYGLTDDEWRQEVIDRLERGEVNPHGDLDPIYQQVHDVMFEDAE